MNSAKQNIVQIFTKRKTSYKMNKHLVYSVKFSTRAQVAEDYSFGCQEDKPF